MTIPKIWKKHVPNHQPAMYNYTCVKPCPGYFSWGKVSKRNSALNIMELLWIAKCCTTKMMVETCHVCWHPSDIMGCLPPIKYLICCRISCAPVAPDCPSLCIPGRLWSEDSCEPSTLAMWWFSPRMAWYGKPQFSTILPRNILNQDFYPKSCIKKHWAAESNYINCWKRSSVARDAIDQMATLKFEAPWPPSILVAV